MLDILVLFTQTQQSINVKVLVHPKKPQKLTSFFNNFFSSVSDICVVNTVQRLRVLHQNVVPKSIFASS